MKFKVLKGTDTFQKLEELRLKIKEVNNQAFNVVRELGSTRYCKKNGVLAGGISAIEFTSKPEGYINMGKSWQSLYFPKAKNKKDLELISKLPTIDYSELNTIVNFEGNQVVETDAGLAFIKTIGLIFGENEMLIDIEDGCKYCPPKDIIEILSSEYFALKEAHEAKKTTA